MPSIGLNSVTVRARRITALFTTVTLSTLVAPAEVTYHTVALTGDPAPGFGPGVTFSVFTTSLNHSIMAPRMDEDGNASFIAIVAPGVDGARSGIWQEHNGVLSLVVRTGIHAPGTPDGVVFAGVPSEYIPFPPTAHDGRVGFQGALTGPGVDFSNGSGAWVGDESTVQLIARVGDPAPGTPGAIFGVVGQPMIADDGRVVVFGSLGGGNVTEDDNEAIWTNRSSALALLLREGDPAPGINGLVLGRGVFAHPAAFGSAAVSSAGGVLLQANLNGPGVDAFNDEALFVEDAQGGGWRLLAREDGQVPGFQPGDDFGGGSVTAQFDSLATNALGDVSFSARVGGSGGTNPAMFSDHRGALEPIVVPGAPAPGTGGVFGTFGTPLLNDAGRIAFRAGVSGTPGFGVFWDQNGEIEPVVLAGTLSTDGSTILGVDFLAGFSASGWLAFAGSLEDPETGYKYGLHLVSPDGALRQVVATGDVFDVRGDGSDMRTVERVVHGGLSEAGAVAFRLDFADESSGHFTARVRTAQPGDLNCDGAINFFDIDPFILALFDPVGYVAAFPSCDILNGDLDDNGVVNFFDIDPFANCLFGVCP